MLSLIAGLTDAGTLPNASMVRDTRKAAKAAGVPEAESDRRVFAAVLGTRGYPKALKAFFTTLGPVVASFLAEHPDDAEVFAGTVPSQLGMEAFLRTLDECGWLGRHRTDRAAHSRWLISLITDNPDMDNGAAILIDEIRDCQEGFAEPGPPPLIGKWPGLHPAVLDALCVVSAISPEGTEVGWISLNRWLDEPLGELEALAEHPALGLRMITGPPAVRSPISPSVSTSFWHTPGPAPYSPVGWNSLPDATHSVSAPFLSWDTSWRRSFRTWLTHSSPWLRIIMWRSSTETGWQAPSPCPLQDCRSARFVRSSPSVTGSSSCSAPTGTESPSGGTGISRPLRYQALCRSTERGPCR